MEAESPAKEEQGKNQENSHERAQSQISNYSLTEGHSSDPLSDTMTDSHSMTANLQNEVVKEKAKPEKITLEDKKNSKCCNLI